MAHQDSPVASQHSSSAGYRSPWSFHPANSIDARAEESAAAVSRNATSMQNAASFFHIPSRDNTQEPSEEGPEENMDGEEDEALIGIDLDMSDYVPNDDIRSLAPSSIIDRFFAHEEISSADSHNELNFARSPCHACGQPVPRRMEVARAGDSPGVNRQESPRANREETPRVEPEEEPYYEENEAPHHEENEVSVNGNHEEENEAPNEDHNEPHGLECHHCGKPYENKRALGTHIRDRHVGRICYWPGCGYTAATEWDLTDHFHEHQREAIRFGIDKKRCPWPGCTRALVHTRSDTVQRCIKRHNRLAPRGH
ncbi:hypothetical protein GGS24DRAFT_514698 [Hypoxylon argillaceum]|nr:hypothetical protein GGS24DRAFT_514698 [Hypoxylon argillaceum]KAI1149572.1 hypothetical protein F4825DRAFT_453329 [Nemania diffusa]